MSIRNFRSAEAAGAVALLLLAATLAGCASRREPVPVDAGVPKELNKMSLPEYRLEPPDVLQVDLVAAVPKPPYKVQPLDVLSVRVPGAPADNPVAGPFAVDPDGTVNLGALYGAVPLAGLTLPEAKKVIEAALGKLINAPAADVSLLQGRALQQVRGQRLVRPDGAVGLGTYGAVRVVGMTVPEAKAAIEGHLAAYFAAPEVSVEVVGYNSKVYYVIFDGAGSGQQVTRLPVTGGETVLDAIGQVSGLGAIADDRHIWLARPVASGCTCQVLPVDWKAITECADVGTNYQILPGDRLFVKAYAAVRFDNTFSRVVSPIERVLGFTLLATGAYNTARFINQPINNFGNGNAIR